MKCAILCNGPSRVAFKSRIGYDYILGCNIPWTEVDATVIIDREIVLYLSKHPELIINSYFSRDAWRYTDGIKKRNLFLNHFLGIIELDKSPYFSSGHAALNIALEKGYKEIDIYGCDSRFEANLDSYTHQFSSNESENVYMCITSWNLRWDNMIENNPDVRINFIRE